MTYWKVVPICAAQRKDVRPEALLVNGLYRKCDVYRGGGGYDLFPWVFTDYYKKPKPNPVQFVVQLYGCNLACPYCYVTKDGIWGNPQDVSTEDLVKAFISSGAEVFHLMGGAPGIYLKQWPELLRALPDGSIFHSDLLLTEALYDPLVIKTIASSFATLNLIAVNVKGFSDEEWFANTGKAPNWYRFWTNLDTLIVVAFPFYITFTNVAQENQNAFWVKFEQLFGSWETSNHKHFAYNIDLIKYKALGEEV